MRDADLSRRSALGVLDILADLVPSLGFGDNIPHLPKESFGALSAWGIRALDAYKEGVHDVLHVVGQHAGIMGPDLDQLANLLRRQLADAAEGSLNALELFCEELDVLICSLLPSSGCTHPGAAGRAWEAECPVLRSRTPWLLGSRPCWLIDWVSAQQGEGDVVVEMELHRRVALVFID